MLQNNWFFKKHVEIVTIQQHIWVKCIDVDEIIIIKNANIYIFLYIIRQYCGSVTYLMVVGWNNNRDDIQLNVLLDSAVNNNIYICIYIHINICV